MKRNVDEIFFDRFLIIWGGLTYDGPVAAGCSYLYPLKLDLVFVIHV